MTPSELAKWLDGAEGGTRVFLVGASGCGMACLGHLFLDLGLEVAGSDLNWNDFSRVLADRGAVLYREHNADHISRLSPALVIYSSAIPKDNPELCAARQRGIPTMRRAEILSGLLATQHSVCVAGMHGKTTTAAMLAFALDELDQRHSYAIGGEVSQLSRPARFVVGETKAHTGESGPPWFVAEVDESDGGLGAFRPHDAIVLNIDNEHLDYFVSVDRIRSEFQSLIERSTGECLFCADDSELAEIAVGGAKGISYGFHPLATYRAEMRNVDTAQPSIERFVLWYNGEALGEFTLQLAGKANVSNATAVIAWLHRRGFAAADIARAVARFRGVRRRQEILFADSRFRVIDDYAHHPTEIRETIRAVRRSSPQRLITVFQPHRYTRTECLMEGFASCFEESDQVWLTEIYAAHETPIPGVSGQALAEMVAARGGQPIYEPSLDILRRRLEQEVRPGDVVLFLGAGEITRVAHQLAGDMATRSTGVASEFVVALESNMGIGSVLRLNEPLAKRTTLRVGGPAEVYFEPASVADLSTALREAKRHGVPIFMLGRGSNLLIRDAGIKGLVISLAQPVFSEVLVRGDRLVCGAGARLRVIAAEARRVGLTGLEFLEGIPGTLGGALRMNAGAMGGWMFDVVERLRFMDYDGEVHERSAKELYVEYRGCPLLRSHLALEAVLVGQTSSEQAVRERMKQFSEKRWGTQPAAPSAGCIFKNPGPIPAGKLIDELGLKGTRVGGAAVSDVHGNFIVNDGQASADDVLRLIELVQRRARSVRGIELKTEVQIVGG